MNKPAIPDVKNKSWAQSPLDFFILAGLESRGIQPAKLASKEALIRRSTFDLTGLPPTPEEVDAFLADPAPDAFRKVVDRLLASSHYGETWGRYWLDLVHYGEDDTYGVAKPFSNAFRYRDWVIQAFNQDLPYNLFVKAQIAADLLETEDRANLLPGLGLFGTALRFEILEPINGDREYLILCIPIQIGNPILILEAV